MDITVHPTREDKVDCAVALGGSRRVVGSSDRRITDHSACHQRAWNDNQNCRPEPNATVIRSEHGGQYASWTFAERARKSGMNASMGHIETCHDNAVIEAFFVTPVRVAQHGTLEDTHMELTCALFEYLNLPQSTASPYSSKYILRLNMRISIGI